MVEQVDVDGSGEIEFPEFVDLMTSKLGMEHDEHEGGATSAYQKTQQRTRREARQDGADQGGGGFGGRPSAGFAAALGGGGGEAGEAGDPGKSAVPLPFALLVVAHHRRKMIETVMTNKGGQRQKLVERHELMVMHNEEAKRAREKALRDQVNKKKTKAKFLEPMGRGHGVGGRESKAEEEMEVKMKRAARRRSMAYVDGIPPDELDDNGFPVGLLAGGVLRTCTRPTVNFLLLCLLRVSAWEFTAKACSDIGRVLVLNDPAPWRKTKRGRRVRTSAVCGTPRRGSPATATASRWWAGAPWCPCPR